MNPHAIQSRQINGSSRAGEARGACSAHIPADFRPETRRDTSSLTAWGGFNRQCISPSWRMLGPCLTGAGFARRLFHRRTNTPLVSRPSRTLKLFSFAGHLQTCDRRPAFILPGAGRHIFLGLSAVTGCRPFHFQARDYLGCNRSNRAKNHSLHSVAVMLARPSKESEMSDVVMAQNLLRETWPESADRPAKTCIGMIFDAVCRVERKLAPEAIRERPRKWTERRVRSIWNAEARRIDNYEMIDLEKAALEQARHEYRRSIERAARLAAFLAVADETFHGPEIDRLGQFLGRVDRAGDQD